MSEASHIVVTSDSISMISEAAITGKPIYVVELTKRGKGIGDMLVEKSLLTIKEK